LLDLVIQQRWDTCEVYWLLAVRTAERLFVVFDGMTGSSSV
jgi:hypothetical protein